MNDDTEILPYERKKIYNKMAKYNPYGYKVNLIIDHGQFYTSDDGRHFYCSYEDKKKEIKDLKERCSNIKLYPDIITWFLNGDYAFKAYSEAIQWAVEQKERVVIIVRSFTHLPSDTSLLKQLFNLFRSGKIILFSLKEKVSLNPTYGINSDGFDLFSEEYRERSANLFHEGYKHDYNLSYYF